MLLNSIPENWALSVALFVIACKIVTVFVRPPAAGSRWVPVYQLVTLIALNIGWAANRLQIGRTGVMVARSDATAAKEVLAQASIFPVSGKPDH